MNRKTFSETILNPKSGGRINFALVYPNFYRVGMSNLGIHIIYDLLNAHKDIFCQRFFLDSIFSVENHFPLNKCQIIGFAVSFEPDYFNIIKILRESKINPRAEARTDFDPIIIAGGACATFNPEPLSVIFDAFIIGEGEIILPNVVEVLKNNFSRAEKLEMLSNLPGVYVPRFKKAVKRQWVKNLDDFPAHSTILTDNAEFNMYLIETARGCGRHCRFCMAGYCFRRPRNRSLDVLKAEILSAKKFNKKIGLMGAAISDYPQIDELCQFINENNLKMSVASFRADSVTANLVDSLVKSGLKTLTIAPEVGSEKMRRVINKGITEENIFNAVELGLKAGIKNFKLYFMVGLPFEDLTDVESIVNLSLRVKKYCKGKLTLSVNPFVPKPFTPFQWSAFAGKKYLNEALKILRNGLKSVRGVEMISESIKSAEIQAILARGDKKISEILLKSESEKDFIKNFDLDKEKYLRGFDLEENLAWYFLNQGFDKKYLIEELKRAEKLKITPPCFEKCKRCGVCEAIL